MYFKLKQVVILFLLTIVAVMIFAPLAFAVEETAPFISGATISDDNEYITVTFSEGVWGDSEKASPVTMDDFSLIFEQNEGTVTNAVLTELKTTDDTALAGGETSIRFYFELIDGPADGKETVTITAKAGSIYNNDGIAMSSEQTTEKIKLNDKKPPVFDKDYPKPGEPHAPGSKRLSLRVKPYGESVTTYYVIVANDANAPNTDQVMNGKDGNDNKALVSGNYDDVMQSGLHIRYAIKLSADDTEYDAYVILVDDAGNATTPVKVDLRTPISLLAKGYPKIGQAQAPGSQKIEIINKANDDTTCYYVAVPDGDPAPTDEQIVAGEDNMGNVALAYGSDTLIAGKEKSITTCALGDDSTSFDIYVVLYHKGIDDIYSEVVKLDVVTPPAPIYPPTLQTAIVNHNGDVELTFNKEMVCPAGNEMNFLICRDKETILKVNQAKLKPDDPKIIELILDTKIKGNEAFSVSYTSGTIAAVDGGILAEFSLQPIENNLPYPVLDTANPTKGQVGAPYSFTFTAKGGTGLCAFYIEAGSLPPGLQLANNTGFLSGEPTISGKYTFTVKAVDKNGAMNWHEYIMTIDEAPPEIIPPDFAAGFPKVGTLQALGSKQVSFIVKTCEDVTAYYVVVDDDATAPTKQQIKAGKDASDGEPLAKGSGWLIANTEVTFVTTALGADLTSYDIYVVLNNDTHWSEIAKLKATTPPALPPPFLLAQTFNNCEKGLPISNINFADFTVGGAAPCNYSVVLGALPPGLTLTENGILSGTPIQTGTYNFTIMATDSNNLSGIQAYSLKVIPKKTITSFKFEAFEPDIVGVIDQNLKTITLTVPFGTDITNLVPTIVYTGGSISPGMVATDYTNPLTYTITSDDGSYITYKVTVKTEPAIPVSAISITTVKDETSVKEGHTLQMSALIEPANATDSTVTWCVENQTGNATISESGQLTARKAGKVNVKATANDGSGVEDAKEIIITSVGRSSKERRVQEDYIISKDSQKLEKYDAVFEIPENAVNSDTNVDIKCYSSDILVAPDSSKIASDIFHFTMSETANFSKPITVILPFNKQIVDTSKGMVSIFCYNDVLKVWEELDDIKIDEEKGTVTGKTKEAGWFAVIVTENIALQMEPLESSKLPLMQDIGEHWAKDNINDLVKLGVLDGYPDNTFKPDKHITRAEFTVVIAKVFNLTADSNIVFEDTLGHWAEDDISKAAAQGIITGYNEKSFGPDDPITREQMAVMIVRAAQFDSDHSVLNLADSVHISSWAKEAISALTARQIMVGYTDETFKPDNHATRAETATIICRMLELNKSF